MPPRGPYLNGKRYWANLPGLGRRPLVPPGEKLATDDYDVAAKLYGDAIARLETDRRNAGLGIETSKDIHPATYAVQYLAARKQECRENRGLRADDPLPKTDKERVDRTWYAINLCLNRPALAKVGSLRAITRPIVDKLSQDLKTLVRTKQGNLLRPATVRRMLMEVSGMLTAAVADGYLETNPLRGNKKVPKPKRRTALNSQAYLTRHEVRALLDAVRYSSRNPWAVELATTLFYTGGRLSEITGLLVSDIDFTQRRVIIREREEDDHDVKTAGSQRESPLWPRLAAVLEASLTQVPRNPNGLLFPAPGTELLPLTEQRPMQRLRGTLRSAAKRAKLKKPIGHHTARHSYISGRQEMVELDVLGVERPVPTSYIAREVGHTTEDQIRTTYGHLPRTGVRQTLLDWGERDPIPYMKRYRAERARLVRRRARHEARQAARGRQ
ncbi:MAG: site-specific integrase [Gemmatimonadota bacterium]|nr:site-specific integrase [Gemmatimonadota bacterium]